jgi:hypothetical protein
LVFAGCAAPDPLVGTWVYQGSNKKNTPIHVTSFNLIIHSDGTARSISRTREKGKFVDHKVDSVYEREGNRITLKVDYRGHAFSWEGELKDGRLILRDGEGGESVFVKFK